MLKQQSKPSQTQKHFSPLIFNLIFGFILISGLNIELLHSRLEHDHLSLMRILWVGFMLFLAWDINFREIRFNFASSLILVWAAWNCAVLIFVGGSQGQTLTRMAQACFILLLFFSVQQNRLQIAPFLKSIGFIWPSLVFLMFLVCVFTHIIDKDSYAILRRSIVGMPTNFSIFCAQMIGFFLIQKMFSQSKNEQTLAKEVLTLGLFILPFLLWQVFSGGRAGILITIILICAFFYLRRGLKGTLFSFIAILSLIFILDTAIQSFFTAAEMPKSGVFKQLGNLDNLWLSAKSYLNFGNSNFGELNCSSNSPLKSTSCFLATIDQISSYRITVFLINITTLNTDMMLFGKGLDGSVMMILNQQLQPHIELLRHLIELGFLGFLLATSVYALPISFNVSNKTDQLIKLYLFSFIFITFLQPSGPLSHINNAVIFWIGYATLLYQDDNR